MFPSALCTNLNVSLCSSGHLLCWQVEVTRVVLMAIFKVEPHAKGYRVQPLSGAGARVGAVTAGLKDEPKRLWNIQECPGSHERRAVGEEVRSPQPEEEMIVKALRQDLVSKG